MPAFKATEQLPASGSGQPLQPDQIPHHWRHKTTDGRDVPEFHGLPGSVVVRLSSACQERGDTFEPIQNGGINQLVRNRVFEDSPNPAHTRVD